MAVDHLIAPPLKVAVIGGGVAGLAAARALKSEGHEVVIYEKSDKLGGEWVYDPRVESDPLSLDPNREIVHSSLYHSLRTNLPRQLMGFSDYPFSTKEMGDPRTFPGHGEVLQFLNEFAAKFQLGELIRFNTEVVRVERLDMRNDEWVIESRNNGANFTLNELFTAVVVCVGHNSIPKVADFPGREKWPGKQIHSHNYRVPDPFEDKIDHANENGEVVFEDGAVVHADIILHCTGYMFDFPFLKTEGIVSVEEGRVGPLYNHIFPPKLAPNLSFLGLPYMSIVIELIDLQAKWVARILSGKSRLPSTAEMEAEVQRHYLRMEEKGIPKRHTHSLHFKLDYLDWLANEVGMGRVQETTRSLWRRYLKFIMEGGKWNHRDWEP